MMGTHWEQVEKTKKPYSTPPTFKKKKTGLFMIACWASSLAA